MNFMKVFLIFLWLEQGSRSLESQIPSLGFQLGLQTLPQLEHCSRGRQIFLSGGALKIPLFSTTVALCLGGTTPLPPPPFVVAALASNKVRNLNVLRVMLRLTNIGSLSTNLKFCSTLSSKHLFKLTELNRMLQANQMNCTSLIVYFTLFTNHLTHAICCKLVTILPETFKLKSIKGT